MEEEIMGVMKDTMIVYNCGGYYGRNTYGASKQYKQRMNVRPPSYNKLKLPLVLRAFDPEDYIEWEERVEALFYSYDIFEEDKVQFIIESFPSSILDQQKYIREYRCRNCMNRILSSGLIKFYEINLEFLTMTKREKSRRVLYIL